MHHCLACELPSGNEPLCSVCFSDVPWVGEIDPGETAAVTLAGCEHAGLPRHWVHALKYRGDVRAAQALGFLLGAMVEDIYAQRRERLPHALVAVPLHWSRHLTRGRNQAALIARATGSYLHTPLRWRALQRHRATPSQKSLDRKHRLQNLAGSFRARAQRLRGDTHVALIDDVYTTGATLAAATQALQEAGVERVDHWCATYTRPPADARRRIG